jgi:hypothetical protein
MAPRETMPCERCGTEIKNSLDLPSATAGKGARLFHCLQCDHLNWSSWIPTGRPPQDQPQVQQQQQVQPNKNDEKE